MFKNNDNNTLRTIPHQRCASEKPVGGGSYVIFCMRTMRFLAAAMVDCTATGCNTSCSTQAETLTAIQGVRHLLRLKLAGKRVETYCDNAAVDQRRKRINNSYASHRQTNKMSDLASSKVFSELSTELQKRCTNVKHIWEGAEHNLKLTADRDLSTVGNMLADHYADIAARTSALQTSTIARSFPVQTPYANDVEIRVNGAACATPIGTIMRNSVHAHNLHAMQQIPHNNCTHNTRQRHQHCRHAANEVIDFKTLKLTLDMCHAQAKNAFDRHTLDGNNFEDKILCTRLPKAVQTSTKKMLQLRRNATTTNGPTCLLCGQPYGDGETQSRLARHAAYDCKYHDQARQWLKMSTASMIYHAGESFHAEKDIAIGRRVATGDTIELFQSEPQMDSYRRIIIPNMTGKSNHTFDVETLETNWNNQMLGATTSNAQTLRATRKKYLSTLVTVALNTLKAGPMIKSIQPHPAVLRWFAKKYNLTVQHDCTPFNSTNGVFPSTPHMSRNVATDESSPSHIGMRHNVGTKEMLKESCFLSIETCVEKWQDRLRQAGESVAKGHIKTAVCMITLNGTITRRGCIKHCSSTGGVEILHCPQKCKIWEHQSVNKK